jgi:hypothetical protein
VFTDNQAVEGTYYHVTSPYWALFELVVMLYKLQMKYELVLHVVWIAWTQVIQQGTYGLSRGEDMGPATRGLNLAGIVSLHIGTLEQSPQVSPEGWYTNGHTQGNFLCPTSGCGGCGGGEIV